MLTALSMSLKTNLVFPQDVGPTTMPVNGSLNVRLMTTTDLCRARARLFIASEKEEQWWKIRRIPRHGGVFPPFRLQCTLTQRSRSVQYILPSSFLLQLASIEQHCELNEKSQQVQQATMFKR